LIVPAAPQGDVAVHGPALPKKSPASTMPSPLASYQSPISNVGAVGRMSATRNVPLRASGTPDVNVWSRMFGLFDPAVTV
jgi:hypothetical protein